MALEPTGVDLQAKNFQQYIRQLSEIDKQQRATFDQEFKGLGLSYSRITSEAKKYEGQLARTKVAQDKLAASQQRLAQRNELNRSLAQLTDRQEQLSGFQLPRGLGALGAVGLAAGITTLARSVADASRESAMAAANFNAQVIGINNLAASYGQSGAAIRAAMREASQGVLSESAIIQAANQALLLNVARTPEQFEEITRVALILGRTMGLTATQAIEQFNTALGRKSLLILDNFGISSKAVNAEIEKLAQQRFGEVASGLSQAQKDTLFLEAALKVASEAANAIGDGAIAAAGDFDRLAASAENLKIVFGEVTLPLESALARLRGDLNTTLAQLLTISSAGLQGIDDFFILLGRGFATLPNISDIFDPGAFDEFTKFLTTPLDEIAPDLFQDVEQRFKDIASAAFGISFEPFEEGVSQIEENTEALKQNENQLKTLQSAVRQAENLQLSFARAAEDAARQQGRQLARLNQSQFKDRIKLLNEQGKKFDQFQRDELEAVRDAEEKLNEARQKAGQEQKREQEKLFRELRQARDRFDLDTLQSRRRFDLQDRRLRAAGDILALQELREDFQLSQQEAKENFDLQNRQRKEDAKDQAAIADERRQEQVAELERELADLQNNLDQRRQEFLAAQDEEFNDLLAAQAEQQLALQQSLAEQEEDRRISQQRQLEDLGRSLAEQEDITKEGAAAIAAQLEEAFGVEGVADQIMSGFALRQENAFQKLFQSIASGAKTATERLAQLDVPLRDFGRPTTQTTGGRRLPGFQEGGIVPGPIGSPQIIQAHGGETILPTHQMSAPIIANQTLDVRMSGGFDIRGGERAGQDVVQAALTEMTDAFEVVVRRLGRRI